MSDMPDSKKVLIYSGGENGERVEVAWGEIQDFGRKYVEAALDTADSLGTCEQDGEDCFQCEYKDQDPCGNKNPSLIKEIFMQFLITGFLEHFSKQSASFPKNSEDGYAECLAEIEENIAKYLKVQIREAVAKIFPESSITV